MLFVGDSFRGSSNFAGSFGDHIICNYNCCITIFDDPLGTFGDVKFDGKSYPRNLQTLIPSEQWWLTGNTRKWFIFIRLTYLYLTGMPVPIAIIVCEGDLETIAHIADALQNKLPVIIMKGSGKAADLIVDYLQRWVHSCWKKYSTTLHRIE